MVHFAVVSLIAETFPNYQIKCLKFCHNTCTSQQE